MPRYVILEHDHPVLHWDLMLESGDVLRTWRLATTPEPGRSIPAEASFDHRRLYLDYEGSVSGNRGQVRRWDGGTFLWLQSEEGRLLLELRGTRLQGKAQLENTANGQWLLTLEPFFS